MRDYINVSGGYLQPVHWRPYKYFVVCVFQCGAGSLRLIPNFRPVSLQQRFGSPLGQNKNIMNAFLTNNLVKHLVFLSLSCQAALWIKNTNHSVWDHHVLDVIKYFSLASCLYHVVIWLTKKIYSLDIYFSSFVLL